MKTRRVCAAVLGALLAFTPLPRRMLSAQATQPGSAGNTTGPGSHADVDAAFARFWSAAGPDEVARATEDLARSGVSFAEAYKRLRQGRPYAAQRTGLVPFTLRTSDGVEHHYALTVPETYDPTRKYQARFQLHGGVMMRHDNQPPASGGGIGALAGDVDQIYIVPFAWDAAPWWSDDQVLNLRETLAAVKRLYNLDENRIVVSGVSDGGTGAYYIALRDTTPYAAFLPLNGFWGVLANHDLPVDGPLYPGNMRNKPFFIVNGERDPLYPADVVNPAVEHYRRMGVSVDYRPQAGAGHNTQWWPSVKDSFEAFVRDHPRDPLPDKVTWETANPVAFNRAHWLVVDALGATRDDSPLDDPNLVPSGTRLEFGVHSIGNRVNRVLPGSNAEQIGLKKGDALVRLNEESVHVSIDIEEVFARITPGSPITLLVARDNAPVELSGTYQPRSVSDPPHPMFDRGVPSGRVDLIRAGNTVTTRTRGVAGLTLLLSPDRFDLSKPVTVVVNGRTAFRGRVEARLPTLLKWAAIDGDRTMLFAAELHVAVATGKRSAD